MEIPVNTQDNAKSRMDQFVQFVVDGLKDNDSVKILDYTGGNDDKVPGITYDEAKELSRMFGAKGYHASAYYIDCPSHGFRWVTISKHICHESSARFSHTEVWA